MGRQSCHWRAAGGTVPQPCTGRTHPDYTPQSCMPSDLPWGCPGSYRCWDHKATSSQEHIDGSGKRKHRREDIDNDGPAYVCVYPILPYRIPVLLSIRQLSAVLV